MQPAVDLVKYILGPADLAKILPQLHLVVWSCALLLLMVFLKEKRFRRVPFWFSVGGFVTAGWSLARQVQDYLSRPASAPGEHLCFNRLFSVDGLSLFFGIVILLAGFLTTLLAERFLNEERAPRSEFYALLLLCASAMLFLVGAMDLVTLYISLEFMAISIYILVGYLKRQPRATEASIKYFILGAFSSGLLLFGMSFLYGLTGSTQLQDIQAGLTKLAPANQPVLVLAMVLVLAGLCFKIAAVPFHMWCPDAYEGAPTPFTAFMSAAPKAAAFAVLIRLFAHVFQPTSGLYTAMLAGLSILTMTLGNVLAVKQTNVKRLLAYSSISHAGYLLMGLTVRGIPGSDSGAAGLTAVGVYLGCYLFMNIGAFAVLIFLRRKGLAGEDIEDFSGLVHRSPGLAVAMGLFLLSLAGIPPLAGFLAKFQVFGAVIARFLETHDRLFLYLAVVGALNAVVALFYYARILRRMFMGEAREIEPATPGLGGALALALTLTGTVGLGLYPAPLLTAATWIAQALQGVY